MAGRTLVRLARRLGGKGYRAITALSQKRFDRRFDADVGGHDYIGDEGIASDGNVYYEAASPLPAEVALRRLRMGVDDVLVDIGCGKGRVVLIAGQWPIKRVIGIDLADHLIEIARRNVERNRARLRVSDVVLETRNVLDWDVPDDVTVIFMYHPFLGEVFAGAWERILASYDRNPRPLRLVYAYPWENRQLLASGRVQTLDVIPADLKIRPGWFRRGMVIVTYQVTAADGSAPEVHRPRHVHRKAIRYWSVANPTSFVLGRPGLEPLRSDHS